MFLCCLLDFVVWTSCKTSTSTSFSKTLMLQNCCSQDQLVREHNAKYNPRGVKRGEPSTGDNSEGSEDGPDKKRLCIEKTMSLSDESLMEDKPHGLTDPFFSYEFTCLIKCLVNLIFVIFWNLWIWIVSGWRWHAVPSRCVSTRKKMSYGLVLKNQEFKWKSLRWPSCSDSGLVTLPLALNLGYFWSHHFESLVILLNCGVKIINPTKQII